MNGPLLTPATRAAARDALLDHYDRHARDLPWRSDTDPYRVLVSELMLQQTRVETVRKYYDAWLQRFPTLAALADADEDEVLKAWEGLGYYRRARNLHRAARVVREMPGSALPSTAEALRGLPGVGEYTSGAIASIAFGEPVAAVDGNVRRVLSRLHDVAEPTPRWLRETAARWVDERRPGDWNQALMELGATFCTPRSPSCSSCPLSRWCAARAAGTTRERPATTSKRQVPTASLALVVLHANGRVLVEKRPDEGLLAGMWAFPERRLPAGAEGAPRTEAIEVATELAIELATDVATVIATELANEIVCSPAPLGVPRALPEVRHRFSHLAARYHPFTFALAADAPVSPGRADSPAWPGVSPAPPGASPASVASSASGPPLRRWIEPDDDALALPVAQRRVLESWAAQEIA